jgi:hypothetical protein
MNKLIAFAGVVIMAVAVLPNVYFPNSVGMRHGGLALENVKGGQQYPLRCYHANDQNCPSVSRVHNSCSEVDCEWWISTVDESKYWTCERWIGGEVVGVGLVLPYDSGWSESFENQEPGYKNSIWGGTRYCLKLLDCSDAPCVDAEDGTDRQICADPGTQKLTDAQIHHTFSGNCYEE